MQYSAGGNRGGVNTSRATGKCVYMKQELMRWKRPNGDFLKKWAGLQQARQANNEIFWSELFDCGNYNCIRIYHFCI